MDLIAVAKTLVSYEYYPNEFPAQADDNCATFELTGGGVGSPQIARPSFQIYIRAKEPSKAEEKAWDLYNAFKLKRNFLIGTTKVIYCNAQQSTPLYVGQDDNGRFLYSLNFSTITEV